MKCTLEAQFRICFDDTGESVTVGDDADGLGLVELQYFCDDGTKGSSMIFRDDHVPMLIEALNRFMSFKASREDPA